MGKLEGRVAFVSGGSQGIGEQTALLFGREGASVAVIASSEFAKAENVAKCIRDAGGQASAHVADVRDAKRVAKAVSEVVAAHGPIDILVNSAGVFPPTPAADTDEDVYDKVMDVNVKGTWNTICAIAPSMRARKTGWIVNISSVLGTMALANYAVYCASKAAVNMLTRSLDMMGARTPSGRTYSLPEEMAAMALYLSCADSKPVHGAIMVMDEGFSLGV